MDGKMRLATFALALLLAGLPAHAEVNRDGSIGPLVPIGPDGIPDGVVPGGTDPLGQPATYLIAADLGKQVAGNLFHSFYEFGLDSSAEIATFTGPESVVNVIGRVTGPLRSEIFGTIRSTIDGADLFLLNPRGVFFGQSAVLDVPGSFYTSTAGRLRFAEGPDFDATAAVRDDAALSWAAPTAFGFLGEPTEVNCCAVVIQAPESLTVPAGETLTVVGSNQSDASLIYSGVRVTGSTNTFATIRAPGARVQLASAAGEVDIPLDLRDLDPEAVDDGALGSLFLANDARIDVGGFAEGEAAGTVLIRGGKFTMGGRASLTAVHRGEGAAPAAIDVAVSDEIHLTGSGTSVFSSTRAAGRGGDVFLTGDRVIVDRALVQSETEGAGRGGDVHLSARSVSVDRSGQISSVSRPDAGRGGDVHIGGIEEPRAQSVEIERGGSLVSQTTGSSPGGEIRVDAESLIVSGAGVIESLAQGTDATAVGGTIDIDATNVEVANLGSRISSVTQSPATGGQLWVDAGVAGAIAVTDAGQIITRSDGPGAGGAAHIATGSLEVTDEGRVQTVAQSEGPGGALAIEAQSVRVSNATNRAQSSLISSLTLGEGPDGCCRGGDLTIRTRSLEVVDGGQIQSITEGSGDAGRLEILEAHLVGVRGQNDLEHGGAAIVSRVKEGATGSGGFLSIGTQILEVENGAFITSDTRSVGDAGGLEIGLEGAPAERVTVRGGDEGLGQVSAASIGGSADLDVGEAGDLTIRTDTLGLFDGGQVSSSTSSAGDAGDVRIAARSVTVSGVDPENPANQSGVFAQSNTDRVGTGALAGVVEISAEELTVSDRGTISVSTDGAGDAGAIVIDTERSVRLEGDGTVRAETRVLSTGGGGSIDITTRGSVELFDGGRISAESRGSGDAGDIRIEASEWVTLTEGSSISAETAGAGGGGSIAVAADARKERAAAARSRSA
jgi:filamentous hemagglutinin family protein